jgi:hypothetical protein
MGRRRETARCAAAVAALVLLAAVTTTGCGGLGVDPSGKLACGPAPAFACPSGLSCVGGKCWRGGKVVTTDAAMDTPASADATTDGDAARADASDGTSDGTSGDGTPMDAIVEMPRSDGGDTSACTGATCVHRPNGQACTGIGDCTSGNCVDGFCCDMPCTGQCQACDVKPGTCSPVPSMGAPRNGRPACGAAPCTGYCDGTTTASCHFPANACAAQTCSAGVQTNASTCDSGGHCPAGATTTCQYLCVATACGGQCHPGTYQCTGTTLQYCNGGTWQTQATCSGATPKCDASQQKCVPFAIGDACTSTSQCGTNFCSWGVCCSQQCDTTCTNSCSGGSCKQIADGTTCKTKMYDAPGLNNVYFTCKGGTCKAPTITCDGQEGCDLTNNVCCGTWASDTLSCTANAACPASASSEVWIGCGSSADCPTGLACLFYFQDNGDRYTECVSPSLLGTSAWLYEACDPNLANNTCFAASGTHCNAFETTSAAGLCQ